VPRDASGAMVRTNLEPPELARYEGLLGHFHVQRNKQDPGPAFQWDRVIGGARKLMSKEALAKNQRLRGKSVAIRTDRGTGARPTTAPAPSVQPTSNPG